MLQQSSAAALLPSSQRPVPLRTRPDLVVEEILYRDVPFPVVKDPVGLKYYRLQPEQYGVLQLLDGRRSLQDIRDDLQEKFPTVHVTPQDVQVLISDLHDKGLLVSDRLGQGESALKRHREHRWQQIRQTLLNPLYLRLPGFDPEPILKRIEPWTGWIFDWPAVTVLMMFVVSSWFFLAIRFDDVLQKLPEFRQFFGWPNLIYLWLTLACAKMLHEFGHAISCKHFGSECHSIGVMLLVFSPTLYCDVTDSWMLKNKWHRVFIGAAGMYVEIILAAFAIYIWYGTKPGMLNHLALNVFFVSTVTTVIFNANPLLRYDGYYMLSDYLEIPNLRQKATKMFQKNFAWWCFGIETPDDPFMPTTGKNWFALYAIASAIYRWVVLFGITVFLYTVLKPYRLQSVGIMLAVGSVGAIFISMGINLYQLFSVPRNDPIDKVKVTITLLLVSALTFGILMVPVPWYEEAAFYVEPVGVHHVYTAVPGFLEEIAVRPGDTVQSGQLLARLYTPDLIDKRDELLEQLAAQEVEPKMYRELKEPDQQRLAEQRLSTIQEQLKDVEDRLRHIEVASPIAGRIIEPSRAKRATIEVMKERLPGWHGTPLNPANLNAFLDERTHICSVAPSGEFNAVVLVKQGDRLDIEVGDPIRLKLDEFPGQVFNGKVREFSDRYLQFAPPALSNKFGGPLATVTDPQGREKLTDLVYQAMVDFDAQPELLKTGMRGNARIIVAERTLFGWIWRWFRQTFHFRL